MRKPVTWRHWTQAILWGPTLGAIMATVGLGGSQLIPRGLVEVHMRHPDVTMYIDSGDRQYGLYVSDWALEWVPGSGAWMPVWWSCDPAEPVRCPYLDAGEDPGATP